MTVPKGRRKTSKEEFDAIYYRIHDDAVDMIEHNFRASPKIANEHRSYIETATKSLLKLVWDLINYIKLANSLYPTVREELVERRINQDLAIGACTDILTLYELVMKKLQVKDDMGVPEIKNVEHQMHAIRSWRTSDNKRFKNLLT